MPLYRVEHVCPLTSQQQARLAREITRLHAHRFTTPSLYVNVEFEDVSDSKIFIGGEMRRENFIRGTVRSGRTRTQQDWEEFCTDVMHAWGDIVSDGTKKTKLYAVLIVGGLIGGIEAGFVVPATGEDQTWMMENYASFRKLAEQGDEDMRKLLEEMHERKLLKEEI